MSSGYMLALIGIMAGITFALRALPFLAGRWLNHHPIMHRLGDALPMTIMVLLIIDTVQAQNPPQQLWQGGLAVAAVALLQLAFKQTLLSIFIGTAVYMLLRVYC